MGEETRRRSSELPRWPRILAAVAWIAATSAAGWFFSTLVLLSAARFFGAPQGPDDLRDATVYAAITVALVAAGPFGVWLVRRTRAWLVASVVVVAVGIAWAAFLLVHEF